MSSKRIRTSSQWWFVLALAALWLAACGDNDHPSSAKAITIFSFDATSNAGLTTDVASTIQGRTIAATVPFGTDVSALKATFSTTGAVVTVGTTPQVSDVTPNDFRAPVTYTVTGVDQTPATYTVTVSVAPSPAKDISTFAFLASNNAALTTDVTATINGTSIAATVPFGTNVTALVASFSTTGAHILVAGMAQVSATTANNFASPVTYTVTAADATTKTYTVTLTIASSSAKELTTFKFTSALNSEAGITSDVTATISGTTIVATVPYGTNVTALIATFTTTGQSVAVASTAQVSGTTANSFSNPVHYIVTAADATTKTYTVAVTVALNPAKAITAFELTSALNSGAGVTADAVATITGSSIGVTVPYGTNVTALIATFSTSGQSVAVGSTAQASGITANNFTSPVTYTVTAADGTTHGYTVTIAIALNPAKDITAFKLTSALNSGAGISSDVIGTISGTTIGLTVPYGTQLTALVPTFSTTGASVAVGATVQASGITANNFTAAVTYTVTAANGTTKSYLVAITVAANPAKELTSFIFTSALDSEAGVSSDVVGLISGQDIALTVPYGTTLTALISTFTTTGASVAIGGAPQASNATANDFTLPVVYTVTAANGSTKDFTVTVTVAPNPAKAITSFGLTSALNGGAGISSDVVASISTTSITATVPYGTNVTTLIATFATTGQSVAIGGTAQASSVTANDFTSPVTYTVTAADGTTQDYIVTITIAINPAKDLTSFVLTSALNGAAGITSDAIGTASATTITVYVPYTVDITALIGTFTTTGQSVAVGATAQASGITVNDFTNPITYTVTAADHTTKDYTVSVINIAYATATHSSGFIWDGDVILDTKLAVFLYAPAGTQLNSNADYKAYCESMGFEQNQNSSTGDVYANAGMVDATDYYCSDYCCYLGDGNGEAGNLSDFENFGLPLGAQLQVFDRGCGDYGGNYNVGVVTSDTLTPTTSTSFTYTPAALFPTNFYEAKITTFSQAGVVVCETR